MTFGIGNHRRHPDDLFGSRERTGRAIVVRDAILAGRLRRAEERDQSVVLAADLHRLDQNTQRRVRTAAFDGYGTVQLHDDVVVRMRAGQRFERVDQAPPVETVGHHQPAVDRCVRRFCAEVYVARDGAQPILETRIVRPAQLDGLTDEIGLFAGA